MIFLCAAVTRNLVFFCTANVNLVIAKRKRDIVFTKVYFPNIREVIFAVYLLRLSVDQKVCKFCPENSAAKMTQVIVFEFEPTTLAELINI